jgi:Domain of unknown function (DUF4136)
MTLQSIKSGVFAVVTGLFMAGCGSTAHVEKARNANLSEYKTYSWITPEKTKGAKANRRNDIALQNIHLAVNDELQKKGWQEVQNDPDILVSSELLVEKNQKQQSDPVYSNSYVRSYYNPRSGRYNNFYYPSRFMGYDSYTTTVKEGTITIMLIDTKTDKTVWQGWSTDELNTNHISDREINKNIKSIFKKLDTGK